MQERSHGSKEKKMGMRETVIGLGLATALAWFTFCILFKKHPMEILQETFRKAGIRYVPMGCLCMTISISCETANIRLLMRIFRRTVSFRRSLSYACVELYLSIITPLATGGQPMQLYYMTRDGFGLAQSPFTLLTVAAVYQMSAFLYGTAVVIVRFPFMMAQSGMIHWLLISGILVSGICSCATLLIILDGPLVERVGMCIISFLARIGVIRDKKKVQHRMKGSIMEYSRGGAYLREYPLVILKMFLCSMAQLIAPLLMPCPTCLALGISTEPGSLLAMQAILSLAVMVVSLSGSVGASKGGFMALYDSLFGAGQTFSIMMLNRSISFYRFPVISGLVTVYLQFRPRLRATGEGK